MIPSKKRSAVEEKRMQELMSEDADSLREQLQALLLKQEKIQRKIERNELTVAVTKRRAMRIAGDTLMGCRLDERIEQLFKSVRSGEKRLPVEDVVQIIDGLVARAISRRIWIGIIALITILPAAASLILLGFQNDNMITKLDAEAKHSFQKDRNELLTILQANHIKWLDSGPNNTLSNFPTYHRHIRSGAMLAYIALEKERWSEAELTALPPTKHIDLRNGDYMDLTIGSHLGLKEGETATDLTRVIFDNSKFFRSQLFNVWIDNSSFRNVNAEGARFWLPSARNTDFTEMNAKGAEFAWDPLTSEPFHIENSIFDRANFTNASFVQVFTVNSSFKGTDLRDASYTTTSFIDCDFTQANLGNADFSESLCVLKNCLVTQEQSKQIVLPSYCNFEKTDKPGVLKITVDKAGYMKAWESQ